MEYEIFPDRKKEPSFYDLVRDYPAALPTIKRNLKREVGELKLYIELLEVQKQSITESIAHAFFETLKKEKEEKLKELSNQLYYLTPKEKSIGGITVQDIYQAKQRQISEFIKVFPSKKAVCLFHSDKEPSMHVYGNSYHCFTCEAHGTTVDIIMALRNIPFKDAVKFLICG